MIFFNSLAITVESLVGLAIAFTHLETMFTATIIGLLPMLDPIQHYNSTPLEKNCEGEYGVLCGAQTKLLFIHKGH